MRQISFALAILSGIAILITGCSDDASQEEIRKYQRLTDELEHRLSLTSLQLKIGHTAKLNDFRQRLVYLKLITTEDTEDPSLTEPAMVRLQLIEDALETINTDDFYDGVLPTDFEAKLEYESLAHRAHSSINSEVINIIAEDEPSVKRELSHMVAETICRSLE